MSTTVTVIARKGRITYLPGCTATKAFVKAKLRRQLTDRDLEILKEMGFSVKIDVEKPQ